METSSPAVKIILSPHFSVYGHLFPHKEHLAFWPQNLTVSNVPCSASFIPALIPWEARLPFNTTIPLWDYFFLASGLEVVLYLLSQKNVVVGTGEVVGLKLGVPLPLVMADGPLAY